MVYRFYFGCHYQRKGLCFHADRILLTVNFDRCFDWAQVKGHLGIPTELLLRQTSYCLSVCQQAQPLVPGWSYDCYDYYRLGRETNVLEKTVDTSQLRDRQFWFVALVDDLLASYKLSISTTAKLSPRTCYKHLPAGEPEASTQHLQTKLARRYHTGVAC